MKELIDSVNISDLKNIISIVYRAKLPLLIIGHKGIGKSEIVKQFCRENNLNLIDIRLAYLEAQDIVGFPYRDEKTGKMSFSPPDWLPQDGNGILFLDEINRARIDVLQAVFQLVRDREITAIKINNNLNNNGESIRYRLPDGWSIISAINPETPESQYFVNPLDDSLYDRFIKIPVITDINNFKKFAKSSNLFNKELISFINDEKINLSDESLPPIEIDPTPRSFELFSKILDVIKPEEEIYLEIIGNGIIGKENTKKFIIYRNQFYKEINEIIERILNNWDNDFELKHKINEFKNKRNDILIAIRDRFVINYVSDNEKYSEIRNNKKLSNFINYIFSLDNEMIVAYLFSIREGFGKSREGLYLTDILPIIENNSDLRIKFEKILSTTKIFSLGEYL